VSDGAAQMAKLGRDLKAAGAKELRKELLKAGREMGKPIKAEISKSALEVLPKRGGLAASIAKAKVRVSTRLTGRNVGVSFIGRWSGHDLKGIDEGLIRHPVLGHRKVWVAQNIAAGYFTKVFDGPGAKIARAEFLKAVDAVAAKLRAGG
jgi:hypothetical protein